LLVHPKPKLTFATTAATDVSTNGWDNVYAIPASVVNKGIAQANQQIPFTQSSSGVNSDSVTGTFGPWQLTNSGDGRIMGMTAPITTGSVTVNGTSYPLNGAQFQFNVELDLVPSPVPMLAAGPVKKLLKIKTSHRPV
jgi:hypothetical protein